MGDRQSGLGHPYYLECAEALIFILEAKAKNLLLVLLKKSYRYGYHNANVWICSSSRLKKYLFTGCEDTFSKCMELESECQRPESMSFLKQTCKKTCGFCDDKENKDSKLTKDEEPG